MLRIGFGKKCERERAMWGWLMILQVPRIVYRLASIVLMLSLSLPLSLPPSIECTVLPLMLTK
jgi:hypothetical protein